MLVHARDPHVESGAFHLRRPLGFGDEFLLTYSWINSRRTSVMFWPWAAVAALKALCSSTGTFRFIRFTCCGSGCLMALTSFQEVRISGYEYGRPEIRKTLAPDQLPFPGLTAEPHQAGHRLPLDSQGTSDSFQLLPRPGNGSRFDGLPLGNGHPGRPAYLLDRKAACLAGRADQVAEELSPDPAFVGGT